MKYLQETSANKVVNANNEQLIRFSGFQYSGFSLVDEINALNPSIVLDSGCAYNLFKGKIKNLIGIDVVDYQTNDLTVNIRNTTFFRYNSIDVILALGSLHYDVKAEVILDIEAMVKLLKPKGILIIRTQIFDIDPLGAKCFKWKTHDIQTIGDMFNLKLIKGPFQYINKNVDNVTRWCWWWEKQ
jgi:hypothetical protein